MFSFGSSSFFLILLGTRAGICEVGAIFMISCDNIKINFIDFLLIVYFFRKGVNRGLIFKVYELRKIV